MSAPPIAGVGPACQAGAGYASDAGHGRPVRVDSSAMPNFVRHPALAALLCAAALLAPRSARAVNLVPNPSFESLSSCPTSFSQLPNATPWFLPTTGTSDVYNACVVGFPSFPGPGVPGSPFGFQNA